jgi:hypothetical protein
MKFKPLIEKIVEEKEARLVSGSERTLPASLRDMKSVEVLGISSSQEALLEKSKLMQSKNSQYETHSAIVESKLANDANLIRVILRTIFSRTDRDYSPSKGISY